MIKLIEKNTQFDILVENDKKIILWDEFSQTIKIQYIGDTGEYWVSMWNDGTVQQHVGGFSKQGKTVKIINLLDCEIYAEDDCVVIEGAKWNWIPVF